MNLFLPSPFGEFKFRAVAHAVGGDDLHALAVIAVERPPLRVRFNESHPGLGAASFLNEVRAEREFAQLVISSFNRANLSRMMRGSSTRVQRAFCEPHQQQRHCIKLIGVVRFKRRSLRCQALPTL